MLRVLLVQAQGLPFGFTAQHVAELLRLPQQRPAAGGPSARR